MRSACTMSSMRVAFLSTSDPEWVFASVRTSTTPPMSAKRFSTRWRSSVAEARPSARPSKSRYSFGSIAFALGVVLGIALLVVVLSPRPHYNAVKPIDQSTLAQTIASAQRVAPYRVVVPTGLPSSWQPTSARVDGPDANHVVHLHIGY